MLSTSTAYCPLANKVEYIDRGLLGMHAQVLLPSAFTVEEGALPPNTWFLAEKTMGRWVMGQRVKWVSFWMGHMGHGSMHFHP